MPLRRSLLGLACVVGLLLSGCAITGGGPPTMDRFKPLMRMAVTMATERLLTANPHLVPLMAQTVPILIDAVDSKAFTSIAEVGAFIRARMPWDRIADDVRPFVEALIMGISEELRVIADQHQIPQTQAIVLVQEVLGWVKDVALRHALTARRL